MQINQRHEKIFSVANFSVVMVVEVTKFTSFSKTATTDAAVSTASKGSFATGVTSVGEIEEIEFFDCSVTTGATGTGLDANVCVGREDKSVLEDGVFTPERDTGAGAWESTSCPACNPLNESSFNPSRANCM